MGERVAVVVATGDYEDTDFRRLRAPSGDATEIADVLGDEAIGGFSVTLLLDETDHVIRRRIGDFLADRAHDDTIVVYLSCHGVLDLRGRLYFAAANTVKHRLSSTAVEARWLLDELELCPAWQQVLILDCCFSGSFANTKGEADLERRLGARGRIVLTASRAEEYSFEGNPTGAAGASVFTAALVDGLRSGAADHSGKGHITVDDAFHHAAQLIRFRGGGQSPQRWVYGGEGDIVLARSPHTPEEPAVVDDPPPEPASEEVSQEVAMRVLERLLLPTAPAIVSSAHRALASLATGGPAFEPRPRWHHESTFAGDEVAVVAMAFSADDEVLAIGDAGGSLHFRDVSSGERAGEFVRWVRGPVRSLSLDPTGGALALVAVGHSIAGISTETGENRFTIAMWPGERANQVALSPNGRVFAAACTDGLRMWLSLPRHDDDLTVSADKQRPQNAVAFSPDGRLLVSGENTGTVRVLYVETGAVLWARSIGQRIRGARFTRDGETVLVTHERGLGFLDVATGVSKGAAPMEVAGASALRPQCDILAAATTSGLELRSTRTGSAIGVPIDIGGTVSSVAFNTEGGLIVVGGADGTIHLLELQKF